MRFNAPMKVPQVFIAYAPRGAGLRCALAYLGAERDVYGWYAGPRADGTTASQYFHFADFYTNRPARYDAVDASALHSGWSLDEARRYELARMQDAFAQEWLVDGKLELREERLHQLSKLQPNWTFYSPNFERSVLRHLAKHWPLEFRPQ